MGLVRNIAIGLGVAGVAIALMELNNQGAADVSEEEAVYGDELYAEPVVADVPAMAPAEEVDDFANGGHDAGNGNELVNAVAGVGGSLLVGKLVPGIGQASLAHMALSEINDRWAREGAADLLEENGNVDDLRRYEKRHEVYDQAEDITRGVANDLLDTFLPIPEDAPPILQAVVDGAKETLVDAIHAPLELVKTLDSGIMALHAITPTPEETGAAIKDAFETVATPINKEVLQPIKEEVLVPAKEALERVGQDIENLLAPITRPESLPPFADGTICAAGTTCNTRCKGGKSFYEFPHQRCGDEAYRLTRVAQEKRDREAQEKRDREAQEKRDREAQEKRDREAQAKRDREAQEKRDWEAERNRNAFSTGTICAAGTTCNTRCKDGKSFYLFPFARCGDEGAKRTWEAQEKAARDKKAADEKAARDKKARDEKAARDKKARDEKAARDKKARDEKAARDRNAWPSGTICLAGTSCKNCKDGRTYYQFPHVRCA